LFSSKASVKAAAPKENKSAKKVESVRLHVAGTVLGHRRSKRKQHNQTSLISIESVQSKSAAQFYLGKRVAYIYKAPTARRTASGKLTKLRVIWGKIVKAHGSIGVVQAHFAHNLPPSSYGKPVRVMLYPSKI
jgi:large subunit ribosomal protein L35Ae